MLVITMYISSRQGYSFIEIAVVLFILGAFTILAFPNFMGWLHAYRLNTAGAVLAGNLRAAHMTAVFEGVPYELQVQDSTKGNFYQIIRDPKGIAQIVPTIGTVVMDSEYGEVQIMGSPKSGKITFRPRGTSSTGAIVLRNSVGAELKVVVNNSGRVKIE